MNTILRIAQVSDCHLFGDPNQLMRKTVNPYTNLLAIIDLINQESPWDLLLLTGDIADAGEPLAYEQLAKALSGLNFPCYYLPGNHDIANSLEKHLEGQNIFKKKHIATTHWQFILLNSTKQDCTEGYLFAHELELLRHYLETNPHLFTVIALHHHPIKSNSFMDEVMLCQAETFLNLINLYQNVRIVLFGHVHQVMEELRGHTLFLSAPATAYQIKPKANDFTVDSSTPGFRWLELEYNGNIKTGISRLPMSEANGTN